MIITILVMAGMLVLTAYLWMDIGRRVETIARLVSEVRALREENKALEEENGDATTSDNTP